MACMAHAPRRPPSGAAAPVAACSCAPPLVLLPSFLPPLQYPFGNPIGPSYFWRTIEDELSTIGAYYDVSALSLRNAVYHLIAEGRHGFQWNVSVHRHAELSEEDENALRDQQFYWDENHPWDRTGHRCDETPELACEAAAPLLLPLLECRVLTPSLAHTLALPAPLQGDGGAAHGGRLARRADGGQRAAVAARASGAAAGGAAARRRSSGRTGRGAVAAAAAAAAAHDARQL